MAQKQEITTMDTDKFAITIPKTYQEVFENNNKSDF